MDILSHAALGAVVATLITGDKTPEIAIQGAILGTLPDLLGAPITEGYHLYSEKFQIYKLDRMKKRFSIGTTNRWDNLPIWAINYYYFLHSVLFMVIFSAFVWILYPHNIWWIPTFILSHPFVDIFLHKDEAGKVFNRGIRPLWPLKFSIQIVQWSDIYFWRNIPLIPIKIQLAFWVWFIYY